MKTILILSVLALSLAGCATARETRYATVGGVGGAIVGGPVGAVVGAGGGMLLADHTHGGYYHRHHRYHRHYHS